MKQLLFLLALCLPLISGDKPCPELNDVDIYYLEGNIIKAQTQQEPGLTGYQWEYYANNGVYHGYLQTGPLGNVVCRQKPAVFYELGIRVRPLCNGIYGQWTDFEYYYWN